MGANDPIRTNTEPGSDALVAAVTASIGLTLADRSGGGILANPVIAGGFIGRDRFMKALAAKVVFIARGVDKFATTAEGTDFTILDLASDAATVTPARRGFARQVSDMMRSLDDWSITDWMNFARDGAIGWEQTVVSVLAGLFTSLSATGGNSGGAATWAQIVADYITLGIANVAPPYVLITRPKDWGNVAQDAFSLGGFVAMDPETAQFKKAVNPGFKGLFLGGDLAVYTSAELPTSGGDHVSGMFGAECLKWNAHMPQPSRSTNPILWTPVFGVETDRVVLKSEDQIAYSTHLGASLGINAAGIQMPFLT